MAGALSTINLLKANSWSLIKGQQTLLLTLTGVTGYLCQPAQTVHWQQVLGLTGSLFLTVSGSTVMNMIIDHDIDQKMRRTNRRPLATGEIGLRPTMIFGASLLFAGLLWSLVLSPLYFAIVLTGALVNILVYSRWLKRITPWSILFGGIAGGMPILAGRVLSMGRIDLLGILLALTIVFWIPGHNLTLDMLYADDYRNACIPTVVNVYGPGISYLIITISSLLVASLTILSANLLHIGSTASALIVIGSTGMILLSIYAWLTQRKPSTMVLYKYVSLYLLLLMFIFALAGIF